jgi:hypothetical protein
MLTSIERWDVSSDMPDFWTSASLQGITSSRSTDSEETRSIRQAYTRRIIAWRHWRWGKVDVALAEIADACRDPCEEETTPGFRATSQKVSYPPSFMLNAANGACHTIRLSIAAWIETLE